MWETVLFFHLVSPRDWTQVLRLGDKHPYPLSYLLRPLNSFLSDRVTHAVAKGEVGGAVIAKGDMNSIELLATGPVWPALYRVCLN